MEAQRIQDNGDINRRIGDSYEEEPFSPETEEHWRQVVLSMLAKSQKAKIEHRPDTAVFPVSLSLSLSLFR